MVAGLTDLVRLWFFLYYSSVSWNIDTLHSVYKFQTITIFKYISALSCLSYPVLDCQWLCRMIWSIGCVSNHQHRSLLVCHSHKCILQHPGWTMHLSLQRSQVGQREKWTELVQMSLYLLGSLSFRVLMTSGTLSIELSFLIRRVAWESFPRSINWLKSFNLLVVRPAAAFAFLCSILDLIRLRDVHFHEVANWDTGGLVYF